MNGSSEDKAEMLAFIDDEGRHTLTATFNVRGCRFEFNIVGDVAGRVSPAVVQAAFETAPVKLDQRWIQSICLLIESTDHFSVYWCAPIRAPQQLSISDGAK